jgi:hypothetical protein
MTWERVVYKREDLYQQVWDEPVTHVAKRIGISDVGLAKICKGMGVPLPGRGYWARKAAGIKPSRPPLKPPQPGMPLAYVRHRYEGDPGTAGAEAIRQEVADQAKSEPPVLVPEAVADPHPLVARALSIVQRAERHLDEVLFKHRCLDMVARGAALDRAARIMDSVLRALESRGHALEVTSPSGEGRGRTPSGTFVLIGDSRVQIGIDEAVEKVPLPLPEPRKPRGPYDYVPRPRREYEYTPTGRLRLRIRNISLRGATEVWADRRGPSLEQHLGEFVASVIVAAERQRLDRVESERQRQEAVRREREDRAVEIHNDAHEVLTEDMEHRLKHWRYARDLEAFAAALRARATADDAKVDSDTLVGRWLDWAAAVVAHYDGKALDHLSHLRSQSHGYKLRSRFGWDHKLTMNDALEAFLRPIDEIVQELEAHDRSEGRE